MGQLTAQNPDSIIASADALIDRTLGNKQAFKFAANWIALQYKPTQTKLMDGEAVYSHLILKYFNRETAFWSDSTEINNVRADAANMRSSLLGMKGKDVWGKDKEGVLRSMYQLKAPVTVLFIYNPDCEHCQEQTPKLRQLYDQYKQYNFEIIGFPSDDFANQGGTDSQIIHTCSSYGVTFLIMNKVHVSASCGTPYII